MICSLPTNHYAICMQILSSHFYNAPNLEYHAEVDHMKSTS